MIISLKFYLLTKHNGLKLFTCSQCSWTVLMMKSDLLLMSIHRVESIN